MEHKKAEPPYRTVIFDCDSTLSEIEGIEVLSEAFTEEIKVLTDQAMNGEVPLEAVYGARLDTIRPTRAQIERIGQRYIDSAVPHARELVAALHALGKEVRIVSGGLLQPVQVFADDLGLPRERVDAVAIYFDDAGDYTGFDADSPVARAGGKYDLVESFLRDEPARAPVALIGDGMTDLEAAPLCARFIAYGGVEARERVFAGADATCATLDFAALVPLLLSAEEIAQLAADAAHQSLLAAHHELNPA